ncbi:MAG TPA: OsmC family protein [Miltoncostaeaceae bacterium]|nr:OsmC family protein [Miltoncostaeaceae bacterium]
MAMRSKRLEFTVSLDAAGTMRADGDAPLSPPAGWTSDHLLLAALVRCSLSSLRYHARRAGLALEGSGSAHGVFAQRQSDGRFALVTVEVELEVDLDPALDPDALRELLAKAERDCFVGASLTAPPSYAWTVNGSRPRGA